MLKDIDEFLTTTNRPKRKTFLFRIDTDLMDYIDHYHEVTGNARCQLVREAIEDKARSNRLIRKLLANQQLDKKDYDYISKVLNEPI